MELMAQQVATGLLESGPADATQNRSRQERSVPDLSGGQDPQGEEVGTEVDRRTGEQGSPAQQDGVVPEVARRRDTRDNRAEDHCGGKHTEKSEASPRSDEQVGLLEARSPPHLERSHLERRGDAEGSPQQEHTGPSKGRPAALGKGVDVVPEPGADDGELLERRVDDAVGGLRVGTEDLRGERGEQEEEGEDREGAVEGDEGALPASSVISVAFDHRYGDGGCSEPLERGVEAVDGSVDRLADCAHRGPSCMAQH